MYRIDKIKIVQSLKRFEGIVFQ